MSDENLVWKIAGGVVLGLFVWTAIERYQQRMAIEAGLRELQRIAADPDPMGWRAEVAQRKRSSIKEIKPIPPGFRCLQGTLLHQVDGGWVQITDRDNQWYCPHGGAVPDCYRVTARSTGCR